jgi:hypothetical protein
MKESSQAAEKTSRRGFTKTVASALVAVPVLASLTSCSKEKQVGEPGTTPSPSPKASPLNYERGANPPVIIDGGSFTLIAAGTLERIPDPETVPKRYDFKFHQKNATSFGPLKGIHIIDDYGYDLLAEYILQSGETLKVNMWIAKAHATGHDEDDDDAATYDSISDLPNIIVQGGTFEVRMDKKIDKDRKLFKRKGKNQKKYQINDWDGGTTPFRLERIRVMVNGTKKWYSDDYPNIEENGFRIYLLV